MTLSKDIIAYRQKFNRTLIGKWMPAEGSFQLVTDTIIFYPEGTGIWTSSGMSRIDEIKFEWKEKADLTIEIREEGDHEWIELKYDFKRIVHDLSQEIILCQQDSDTFYLATTRISYAGELP